MADTDGTIKMMQKAGVKVTRESYIACSYLGEPPEPWTAEQEAELPDELQDWDLFEVKGTDLVYKGEPLSSK